MTMIEIPLVDRHGNLLATTVIDDSDAHLLSSRWHASHDRRYAFRRVNGKTQTLHRAIMQPPNGMQVDHIDGNGLNNRRANLRLATHAQNCINKRWNRRNKSGYKGVCSIDGGRWGAYICHNKKRINLGSFKTPQEASAAYNKASVAMFGEFSHEKPGV